MTWVLVQFSVVTKKPESRTATALSGSVSRGAGVPVVRACLNLGRPSGVLGGAGPQLPLSVAQSSFCI